MQISALNNSYGSFTGAVLAFPRLEGTGRSVEDLVRRSETGVIEIVVFARLSLDRGVKLLAVTRVVCVDFDACAFLEGAARAGESEGEGHGGDEEAFEGDLEKFH